MRGDTAVPTRRDLLGIAVDALTMAQAVERCRAAVEHDEQLSIGVVNAAKIVTMQHDPQLRAAVAGCEMVLADGQSVVWASRALRAPLPERVAGVDLFLTLLAEASQRGYRVYFLGARPDVLATMLDEAARRFPGLKIAGARDGYFQAADEPQVAEEIERSGADLLFVGMSSPRKELFLSQWGATTRARVVHGVGGSFDVLAGVTRRAPVRWQRIGLEWLYRLLQEPRRLGLRYLKTNLAFMVLVARHAMRRRQQAMSAATGSPAPESPAPATPVTPMASAVTPAGGEDR
jgi:N-acetylglucosaminyldiphosphoundecaprenol N-acetyl-beta-D-mannosaminyltransferase